MAAQPVFNVGKPEGWILCAEFSDDSPMTIENLEYKLAGQKRTRTIIFYAVFKCCTNIDCM